MDYRFWIPLLLGAAVQAAIAGREELNSPRPSAGSALRRKGSERGLLAGKGVKRAGASGAVIAKTATVPGSVKLRVRAKGKKKRKLEQTGKVKLKVRVTYTPAGGDPSTQPRKLKLTKR